MADVARRAAIATDFALDFKLFDMMAPCQFMVVFSIATPRRSADAANKFALTCASRLRSGWPTESPLFAQNSATCFLRRAGRREFYRAAACADRKRHRKQVIVFYVIFVTLVIGEDFGG